MLVLEHQMQQNVCVQFEIYICKFEFSSHDARGLLVTISSNKKKIYKEKTKGTFQQNLLLGWTVVMRIYCLLGKLFSSSATCRTYFSCADTYKTVQLDFFNETFYVL